MALADWKADDVGMPEGEEAVRAAVSALYSPFTVRGLTVKNRLALPPMCQYSAEEGLANDWHLVHLGGFAQGGFGLVTVEATAVEAAGRITHGDVGLWHDGQIEPLARIVRFLHGQRAKASIQLAHAGRKASMQRPWYGNGPLGAEDLARGDRPWPVVAATDQPLGPDWLVPKALSHEEIARIVESFVAAAHRAIAAGFDVIEIHGAHGYLLHSFLSPATNTREDEYGGDLAGRMRFGLEVARALRATVPDDMPLFYKVSSIDYEPGGLTFEETLAFARELAAAGVDLVVCSTGGLSGSATASTMKRTLGYQVRYAAGIRQEVGVATQAVGLIVDAAMAGQIVLDGQADLIAIGRQSLFDPFWPLHELAKLPEPPLDAWAEWPEQYAWWLSRREGLLRQLLEARKGS